MKQCFGFARREVEAIRDAYVALSKVEGDGEDEPP